MTLREHIRRLLVRRWQLELEHDALVALGFLVLGLLLIGIGVLGASFLPPGKGR